MSQSLAHSNNREEQSTDRNQQDATTLPCNTTSNNRSIACRATPRTQPPSTQARGNVEEAKQRDQEVKKKQTDSKDDKRYIKPHNIQLNDQVLLKQRRTKSKPPYDPEPFEVPAINGHQITAKRGHQKYTKDAQRWKRYVAREKPDYKKIQTNNATYNAWDFEDETNQQQERNNQLHAEEEIQQANENEQQVPAPMRRPNRPRRLPQRFDVYNMNT